jgi:ABC-type uncharacterized transport system permease subunit
VNSSTAVSMIVSAIAYGTPLLIAGLGELLTERSGVLNLGVEGMMLMGAVSGFFVSQSLHTDSVSALLVASLRRRSRARRWPSSTPSSRSPSG